VAGAEGPGQAQRDRHQQPFRPRQGDQAGGGHRPGEPPRGPRRLHALEEPQAEEHEQRDVRSVEKTPDHRTAQRHERGRQQPLALSGERPADADRKHDGPHVQPDAGDDGEGDQPFAARPGRMSQGQPGRVQQAGGAGGRGLAGVVLEGVPLGQRPRVLAYDVEVDHLRHEVAIGRRQHESDEQTADGQRADRQGRRRLDARPQDGTRRGDVGRRHGPRRGRRSVRHPPR
jgi:hypothetical protein